MAHCYAKRGHYIWGSTKIAHMRSWEAAKRADFVELMIAEIKAAGAKIVRVHSAGDFFDAKYIRKWLKIAKRLPRVVFFAYTRSWRLPRMRKALQQLAALKNFRLWWSTDEDTVRIGRPPAWKNVRVAHMQRRPNEPIPSYANLVFRTHPAGRKKTVQKFIDGKIVCPAENGVKLESHMTCTRCKLCYGTAAMPTKGEEQACPTTVSMSTQSSVLLYQLAVG